MSVKLNLSLTVTLLLFLFNSLPTIVEAGCCNDNYWCDGDPSFLEQPDVSQPVGSTEITISWSEAYLILAKCVDYFYVEYALDTQNGSLSNLNFSVVPVNFERKKLIDDWEDMTLVGKPVLSKYSAKIQVDYDTDYIIRVVAVDKGAGWGEFEGKATVSSDPIFYRSRALREEPPPPQPDPLVLARESIERKYPSQLCSKHRMCKELAIEFVSEVTSHAALHSLRYHEPEYLPPIDLRDENRRRRYEEGRLHHLSQFTYNVSEVAVAPNDQEILVDVTLQFRLLRTTYVWYHFFRHGILSLYHTCGHKLPTAIFQDLDEKEVQESVPESCLLDIVVQLSVPIYPSAPLVSARVATIDFSLNKDDFRYDVNWFSAHFHNLDMLWNEQISLIRQKIVQTLTNAFVDSFRHNRPDIWLKKKFDAIQKEFQKVSDNLISLKGKNEQ